MGELDTQGPPKRRVRDGGRGGDMGRGRQKAKDAKIARQLKYTNHSSDLRDLERELMSGSQSAAGGQAVSTPDDSDEYIDRWADDED